MFRNHIKYVCIIVKCTGFVQLVTAKAKAEKAMFISMRSIQYEMECERKKGFDFNSNVHKHTETHSPYSKEYSVFYC